MASHIATVGGAFQLATVKQKATVDGVHIVTLVTWGEFAPWISGFDLSIFFNVSWLNCQAAWWVFLATRLRNGSSKSLKLALARLDPTKSAGWPSSPNLLQISMPKLCWSTWVHAQRTRIVCWWWIWYSILPGHELSKKKITSPIPAMRQSFGQKPFRNCSCTLSTKSCQGILCSPPQSFSLGISRFAT